MAFPTRPALMAAALALCGCASAVPITVARLSAMDPLTADPGQIEVALILPPGLSVTPGTAVLTLAAQRGDQTVSEDFSLTPRPTPGVTAPDGATVAGFAVSEADLPRMRALQARIADWKTSGPASGSLAVGVGGCATEDGPAPDAKGAVLIRLAKDAPFQPLIRPTPLVDLLGAKALALIGPCEAAQ